MLQKYYEQSLISQFPKREVIACHISATGGHYVRMVMQGEITLIVADGVTATKINLEFISGQCLFFLTY